MRLNSFKTQFIFYGALLIILVAGSLLFVFNYRLTNLLEEELISSGKHLVADFSHASEFAVAAQDPVLVRPFIDTVFYREEAISVAVYNHRGLRLFSKSEPHAQIEESISLEIKEALEKEKKVIKVSSKTKQGELVYEFYAPIERTDIFLYPGAESGVIGFAKITFSLEKMNKQTKGMVFYGIYITLFVVLIGWIVLFFLAETLTKPLSLLKEGVDKTRKGDLKHKVKVDAKNEIKDLAESFNEMILEIKNYQQILEERKDILEIRVRARTKELKELADSLDEQVKERTKELQKRVNELERFHKLTVGRELRMVELKKEIKKIKDEMEDLKNKSFDSAKKS